MSSEMRLYVLENLPRDLIKMDSWGKLEQVLTDLRFIEAKCAATMTYELIADYNAALDALPEAQKEKELKHQQRVKKYTDDLIAYAKGEIKHLEIIPSVKPWSNKKIRKDVKRIINNPTRIDRIRAFSQFVNSESHGLVQFGAMPGFFLQQAYNSASSGPIATAAESIINAGVDDVLLLQNPSQRSAYNPHPTLLRTLEGHTDEVESVSITPDGRKAVSGSKDKTLRVWDLESGQCLKTLVGHTNDVISVSVTPDGKTAVSGSRDWTIRVWDLESGRCLRTLKGHSESVNSVVITPDGRKAVSGSFDETIKVWDIDEGKLHNTLYGHSGGIPSGVYTVCTTANGRIAISEGGEGTLRLWDLETGDCLNVLHDQSNNVNSVNLTPDGRRAISGGWDGKLRVWNMETYEKLHTIDEQLDMVFSAEITPDGHYAVSGSKDRAVRIWDIKTGNCLRILTENSDMIHSVKVAADGTRIVCATGDLISGNGSLFVLDMEKGANIHNPIRHQSDVTVIRMTPDGRQAVSTGLDGKFKIWDTKSSKCIHTFDCQRAVYACGITFDGKQAIAGNWDGTLRAWDLETSDNLYSVQENKEGFLCLAITPDGRRAITASNDNTVCIWNLKTGKRLHILEGNTKKVEKLEINPDGRQVISCNYYGGSSSIEVWDIETGEHINSLEGHKYHIHDIYTNPDGRLLVSGGVDQTIRVWNLETGLCLNVIPSPPYWVQSVDITPDGRRIISGNSWHEKNTEMTLWSWDLATGNRLFPFKGHSSNIISLSSSLNSQYMISASNDKTLRLWSLRTGACLAIFYTNNGIKVVSRFHASSHFALGTRSGEICFLKTANLHCYTAVVTSSFIWLNSNDSKKGFWSKHPTIVCPYCGQRFPVADEILNVITAITHNANLSPDQSPCLELPAEAWDEPRLLSECSSCQKPLKFNPFIVDNRGRY